MRNAGTSGLGLNTFVQVLAGSRDGVFACRLGSEHCLPITEYTRSGPSVHTGSRLPRLAAGVRRFPSDHRS